MFLCESDDLVCTIIFLFNFESLWPDVRYGTAIWNQTFTFLNSLHSITGGSSNIWAGIFDCACFCVCAQKTLMTPSPWTISRRGVRWFLYALRPGCARIWLIDLVVPSGKCNKERRRSEGREGGLFSGTWQHTSGRALWRQAADFWS